ncbi:MAG: winged helix-turn-helix domain-containing protein [Terriglobales bacterium]
MANNASRTTNAQRLTTNDFFAIHYGRAVMPMPPSNRDPMLFRFGVFEVDLAAGDLRKNGVRIRLQGQPFQLLTALLQNAGQVVTRDNLRETIWPADTFVDFDHSLNTAVNKIREALGDSASSPRFVETLARRGYRFIAPVDSVAAAAASADHAPRNGPSTSPASVIAFHPELHVPVPRRGLVRALFALIQAMYLIFYVGGLAHLRAADRVASSFLPGWRSLAIVGALLVTGAVGIPLRFYLLSAVAFDFRKLASTFGRLFPFVLALDQLWAIAPFLLLPRIGVGLAFAATAALLYVPFSERTLVRMAYRIES